MSKPRNAVVATAPAQSIIKSSFIAETLESMAPGGPVYDLIPNHEETIVLSDKCLLMKGSNGSHYLQLELAPDKKRNITIRPVEGVVIDENTRTFVLRPYIAGRPFTPPNGNGRPIVKGQKKVFGFPA